MPRVGPPQEKVPFGPFRVVGERCKYTDPEAPLPLLKAPAATFVERARRAGWAEADVEDLAATVRVARAMLPTRVRHPVREWISELGGRGYPCDELVEAFGRGGVTLDPAPETPLGPERIHRANHPSWFLAGELARETFRKAVDKGQYVRWPDGTRLPYVIAPLAFIVYFTNADAEAAFDEQCGARQQDAKSAAQAEYRGVRSGRVRAERVERLVLPRQHIRKGRIIHDLRAYNERGLAPGFAMGSLVEFVDRLQPGDRLWQDDLEGAYRQRRLLADERVTTGLVVDGEVWIDAHLPFGARLSPYQFMAAIARPLLWLTQRLASERGAGGFSMNYVDDFFGVDGDGHARCFQDAARILGVPCEESKRRAPCLRLERVLGMSVDTSGAQVVVECPPGKLEKIRAIASEARSQGWLTARRLQRLVGKIGSVAVGVTGARVFSGELYRAVREASQAGRFGGDRVELDADAQEDLAFWAEWVNEWNGRVALPHECGVPAGQCIASDAAGAGVWPLAIAWFGVVFYFEAPEAIRGATIAQLEFFAHAVLGACCAAVFGSQRVVTSVEGVIDNTVAQAWHTKGRARAPYENRVLRRLGRMLAVASVRLATARIATGDNELADLGTRDELRAPSRERDAKFERFTNRLPRVRPEWWPAGYAYPPRGGVWRAGAGSAVQAVVSFLGAGDATQQECGVEAVRGLLRRLRVELGQRGRAGAGDVRGMDVATGNAESRHD